MKTQVKQNCKFFKPDMPCVYHKTDKRKCVECKDFSNTDGSILIIKKEAAGDVLRTTAILEPLKKKFSGYRIIWLVAKQNMEVLKGNPLIDTIWTDEKEILQAISFFNFNVLINLDLNFDSLITAGISNTKLFYGFRYNKNGEILCSNKAAEEWFLMSHNDEMKKLNRKTYQKIIADITELDTYENIIVPLEKNAMEKAESFKETNKLSGKKLIGIHTGGGSRWQAKKWTKKNLVSLLELLTNKKYSVLLFGGEEEKETMESLANQNNPFLISTGYKNTIPEFFSLLNLCDVIVSADTLAMHAAIGLNKKVVALFGPTSPYEIEGYGRIEKIVTPLDCYCCYKKVCDRFSSCMEMITPETVFSAIEKHYE